MYYHIIFAGKSCLVFVILALILFCVVGAGDDLITPVYVPPTRPPSTTKGPKDKDKGAGKPCDDEDCFDGGSGSGEIVTTPDAGSTDGSSPTVPGQWRPGE